MKAGFLIDLAERLIGPDPEPEGQAPDEAGAPSGHKRSTQDRQQTKVAALVGQVFIPWQR